MSAKRFMRVGTVSEMTGLPISTIYYWMGLGRFPRNFRLSSRAVAWDAAEVEAWQAEQLAGREQASAA